MLFVYLKLNEDMGKSSKQFILFKSCLRVTSSKELQAYGLGI